jgi:hypothetical protein
VHNGNGPLRGCPSLSREILEPVRRLGAVKMREPFRFQGNIKSAVVSRTADVVR